MRVLKETLGACDGLRLDTGQYLLVTKTLKQKKLYNLLSFLLPFINFVPFSSVFD